MLQLSLAGATRIGGLRMLRTISPVKRLHGTTRQRCETFLLVVETSGTSSPEYSLLAKVAHSQLTVSPTSLNFGSMQAGSSTSQALILSNSGKSCLTVSQAIVTGQGFSLLRSPSLPFTLTRGQSVTVNLAFAPVSGGSASGSFSLVSSAISTHDHSGKHNGVSTATTTVVLNGLGSVPSPVVTPGLLVAYPSSLGFSALQVGSSQTLSATLTNSGGTAVTISQATILQTTSGNSFTLNGLGLPTTLAAGQRVTFTVTFAPLSAR
jgi:Abnormal spindle-like microcephaly-assoc'd, ASPM-SPD-2-Hydin